MAKTSRTITAAAFKATCLALLDEVGDSVEEFVVTRRGVAVARLVREDPEEWPFPDLSGYLTGELRRRCYATRYRVARRAVIVIDTNVMVWSILDPGRLSRAAASALGRERDIRIPAICFWEFSRLAVREQIPVRRSDVPQIFADLLERPALSVAQLTPQIGYRAAHISPHAPMDPADQLVAATALVLNAPLVTADERLRSLPGLHTLW